ncbi:acyl carrier protein [Olsenella urininfantis]|uniref:acyl carrier protein n=1 Tax=Olsenella urininfantis TaxID=1871033 RepID=UPI000987BE15|nr:acyl carrier protein [Olsenella urininfantis]
MDEITLDAVIDLLSDIKDDVDFSAASELVDARILDSFDIISIVSAVDEEFDIAIPAKEIRPENFNSAAALCSMLQRLDEED